MGKIVLTILRSQWDRVSAVVAAFAGAAALIAGWLGVSGTAYPAEQIPYVVSGGLAGIFLLGLAGVLWLSADLRDEWRKLDQLESDLGDPRLRALLAISAAPNATDYHAEPAPGTPAITVVASRSTRGATPPTAESPISR